MVPHQARGHLTTRGVLIPEFPAHVVAVFQYRRIRSGDARRPYGAQEVRDGGAGRRGQAHGNDGSKGTDENPSDHEKLSCSLNVYLNNVHDSASLRAAGGSSPWGASRKMLIELSSLAMGGFR